jgi:hypothetical protein
VIKVLTIVRGVLLIGLYLLLLGAAGCHHSQESRAFPFPASNEVIGWVRTGEVRAFQAADLWKYIDGDAERYLKAGVQTVATADYRFRDKSDATVDIYAMATASGAQQIFAAEPVGDAKLIQLGDGARLYSQSLLLRKGSSLVRITAYSDSADTRPALLDLACAIEKRLTR